MPGTERGPRVLEFKPLAKNSLRGFATVEFPSGLIMSDVSVHVSHGRPWASPPSRPMIDREGQAMRDGEGKLRYSPVVTFTDKAVRGRWSDSVIAAIRAAHPDALTDEVAR